MLTLSADSICAAVRGLVIADTTNIGIEVTLPVAYPDGDLVTVVVEQSETRVVVHDAGFAAMRLSQAGVKIGRAVSARLRDYAHRFKCAFEGGRVSAECDLENVAITVALVANGSRSVADYALEIKKHAEADFRQLLSDLMREIVGKRLRENEELHGKSGRKYRVSAVNLDESESAPQTYVTPVANRHSVPTSFAMLYDLKGVYPHAEADAVYDETEDFSDDDRALLSMAGVVLSFAEAKAKYRAIMGVAAGNS